MKKNLVVLFVILSVVNGQAQDLIDKISKKACKCIEQRKDQNQYEENFKFCMEEVVLENLKEIKDYYKVESVKDIDFEDFASSIGIRIIKICDIVHKQITEEERIQNVGKYETDKLIECDKLKTGKYYYLIPTGSGSFDTTHVILNDKYYTESMKEGNFYSKLSVKWTKCHMQLTFIESNDPFKSKLSKPGDQYEYEIIQNNARFIVLKMVLHNDIFFIEYYKE